MSTTESHEEESSTSNSSSREDISDYEVEVEEIETISDGDTASDTEGHTRESSLSTKSLCVEPYDGEPIANNDWVKNYEEEQVREKIQAEVQQDRLNGRISVEDWCKCNNCGIESMENAYEMQCCREIVACIDVLKSNDVLEDVKTPPDCITYHPGFAVNCLEKWTLRLAASKYKRKDRRKYIKTGSENGFLRSIAYRQYVNLVYGTLGRLRIPLPCCVYKKIRGTFPSKGQFRGFEENSNSDSD